MARPKKTTGKTAAKKATTTRKTTARKAAARKSAATGKAAAKKAAARKLSEAYSDQSDSLIRRPAVNAPPQPAAIDDITSAVMHLIDNIDEYAANLRALDRMRHNGVGLKRLGFIEAAFRISKKFPQYFPHWLWTGKFQNDLLLFRAISSLVDACRSLEEKAWNINIESSDMIYTNALEYYAQVKDAAERRVDSAEAIYVELYKFFHRGPIESEQPTQKESKRDINSLMKGKKDGEIIIRNVSPKVTRGRHEIINQTFKSNASFKETEEGSAN